MAYSVLFPQEVLLPTLSTQAATKTLSWPKTREFIASHLIAFRNSPFTDYIAARINEIAWVNTTGLNTQSWVNKEQTLTGRKYRKIPQINPYEYMPVQIRNAKKPPIISLSEYKPLWLITGNCPQIQNNTNFCFCFCFVLFFVCFFIYMHFASASETF